MKGTASVGLDVHKEKIAVAVMQEGCDQLPRELGEIPNTPEAVAKLVRKLGPAQNLSFCYEAGPCGYTLYRQLTGLKAECVVVASSLIPMRSGDTEDVKLCETPASYI